ncbi:MAG TPA: DNA polymerase Y family protein, partial [Myxococcaceae bacterium]|nr:DNA polymerase Y family protein [Myxococcaceae bacterium]
MSQRVAYVHLPRFPVQRRVLDEPGLGGQPLALVHEAKGALRVAFASGTAQRDGIRAGMTLTAARALLPALRDGLYDAMAEAQALSSLAEGFLRFTPAFMLSAPDGLWLDASASSLFGGESGLVEKVEAQARAAGYRARVVLASEPFTARALARFGAETRACVAPGGSERALAALPLQALEDAPEVVASLRALGLSTLGELSTLQPTQVISRLGA